MGSIINETNLMKIENIRKWILRIGIWMLVGGVVLGATMILVGGTSSGEIIGKFMGTLFIVALMMMISVNNFKLIASRDATIQVFALVGLVSNLVWAVFWVLLCWNPDWFTQQVTVNDCVGRYNHCGSSTRMSFITKIALIASFLSALGFANSNVWAIYEGNKKGMIRPLKITAIICAIYVVIYLTIMALFDFDYSSEVSGRFGALAGFMGFVWFVIVITAAILSKNENNKREAMVRKEKDEKAAKYDQFTMDRSVKSEEELRAEIEEQVRREMIEKEVRARMEAERSKPGGGQTE